MTLLTAQEAKDISDTANTITLEDVLAQIDVVAGTGLYTTNLTIVDTTILTSLYELGYACTVNSSYDQENFKYTISWGVI